MPVTAYTDHNHMWHPDITQSKAQHLVLAIGAHSRGGRGNHPHGQKVDGETGDATKSIHRNFVTNVP